MFRDETLQEHLESSNTVESGNAIIAEWNMNIPGNIQKLGNYRYRQNSTVFGSIPDVFDPIDSGGLYTGATDSDVTVEYGLEEDSSTPLLFTYPKDKEKLYYSLEDCTKPYRPRSGINKLSYFNSKSLPSLNEDTYASTFLRPRYYMSTRDDEFKYWRSYRTESNTDIQITSVVSSFATIKSIVSSGTNSWTAVVSGLDSTLELPVGKIFSSSKTTSVVFGTSATVENIQGSGPWTANLTGLTSTAELRVGDRISAISDTGAIAGGTPQEVLITAINSSTSITYTVVGGTTPVAGSVTSPLTIPGEITAGEARVSSIIDSFTVAITISGPFTPTPGNIKNVYINKYNTNIEYGVSKNSSDGVYTIEDCNPFVAYQKEVPANRLVVKVQTNVGDTDLGPFRDAGGNSIPDPFFGEQNKTVPRRFKIQYLGVDNKWINAYEFDENITRSNGDPVFGPNGHLELEYGIKIPSLYQNNFNLVGTVASAALLPSQNIVGTAYIVTANEALRGRLHVYNGSFYDEYEAEYSWFISEDDQFSRSHFVTNFVNPVPFNNPADARDIYREFVWLKGIRLAVETMNMPDIPLELIEISPRLAANVSNFINSFDIQKSLADLASSAVPVGNLIAGTGRVELFDPEQIFNPNNAWNMESKTGSIIAEHYEKKVKFVFYEVIRNVENNDYYVPLKTLYTDNFPETSVEDYSVTIELRDFYFHLESIRAPRLLLTEVSLSQAIALLLDSIGFSNYVFKRGAGIPDPVIPYFFVPPDQNITDVLAQLAIATQSAMFFDEYNNLVVMTKEYLLDDENIRTVDMTLYGASSTDGTKLPNILSIGSQEKKIYNAGQINYTTRYIQKGAKTIAQSNYVDREYVYSPSILWEAAGTEKTTSANTQTQSDFALSAMPLNTTLTADLPTVVGNVITNNVIDIGESAYWITRFKGFFYANSEIIKYDAVQYSITGPAVTSDTGTPTNTVWISSNQEYQRYFSKLPFNGKIYPTGLVRIYAEPFYETIDGVTFLKNGAVVRHGRGQFGTPIVTHNAALDSYWSNNENVRGCQMDSSLLYTTRLYNDRETPDTIVGEAGTSNDVATRSQRGSIIRNFVSSKYYTEDEINYLKTTKTGTVQSSAFIMTGPDFATTGTPPDFVTYVHKPLNGAYKHFGTRLRIIGRVESASDRTQTVVGGMTYFNITGTDPTQNVSIGGGSAGINLVNPATNNGYYFELAALTSVDIEKFLAKNDDGEATVSVENLLFYKVKKAASGDTTKAIPVRLWGGVGNIVVDDGNFAGQFRYMGEKNPTVYDIAIEYVDVSVDVREFYLYINQKLVAKVIDDDPIPLSNPSLGVFVRGTSKAMFENVYALSKNYASNTVFDTNIPIAPVFGDNDSLVNASEALSKYAISGTVQKTYLSSINPSSVPDYNLYFEEFGTIMREAAYFNVKYDRAYPALYARIAPTFNRIRGYTISGFTADSYGAEFLVFNNTDTVLVLDDKSSNYLRIQGITFTQDTTNTITVDDYLKQRGDLADPELQKNGSVTSPLRFVEQYDKVRISRSLYGKNDFTLDSIYIQDADTAENILGWIIEKNIRPRKLIGLNIFSTPTLQLGDIVNINYKNNEGIDLVSDDSTRYVVYNIEYTKSVDGPDMTVYLSEV